jgi:hypothetical protein
MLGSKSNLDLRAPFKGANSDPIKKSQILPASIQSMKDMKGGKRIVGLHLIDVIKSHKLHQELFAVERIALLMAEEEIDNAILKKYEILSKLGKGVRQLLSSFEFV